MLLPLGEGGSRKPGPPRVPGEGWGAGVREPLSPSRARGSGASLQHLLLGCNLGGRVDGGGAGGGRGGRRGRDPAAGTANEHLHACFPSLRLRLPGPGLMMTPGATQRSPRSARWVRQSPRSPPRLRAPDGNGNDNQPWGHVAFGVVCGVRTFCNVSYVYHHRLWLTSVPGSVLSKRDCDCRWSGIRAA